ncbi:unnamed protein product [Ectocarpus fasciculatus]
MAALGDAWDDNAPCLVLVGGVKIPDTFRTGLTTCSMRGSCRVGIAVHTPLRRFQSEVLVRVRPKSVQHRFLKHVHCGEFLAWSPGKWSIGEATAARCRQTFTVLAASNRAGPEVVEIGNCLATRHV